MALYQFIFTSKLNDRHDKFLFILVHRTSGLNLTVTAIVQEIMDGHFAMAASKAK